MANHQDARPFVDLQKDSEEFVTKFEEDIAEFRRALDTKITTLICDPDSFGNPGSYEKNPLIEFSKAKYAIFISMKSLVNEREKEWIKYLAEMKKLFLENVEIFLAGTKLEVKLPSAECQSVPGTQKSPGNRKSSLIPSSLYPNISNLIKNIPALSSPRRNEVHSSESEETETFVSPRNRSFLSKMEIDEMEIDLNASRSSSRSRRSAKLDTSDLKATGTLSKEKSKLKETSKLNNHVLPKKDVELEEVVIEKITSISLHENVNHNIMLSPSENLKEISTQEISKLQGRGNKGRTVAQNKKSKAKGVFKKMSGSESQEEASEFESEISLTECRVIMSPYVPQDRKPYAEGVSQVSSTESQENDELQSVLLKGRGRRGKNPVVAKNAGKITTSEYFTTSTEDSEETSEVDQRPSLIKSRKSTKGTSKSNKTAVSKVSGQSSSEDNEKLQETEINTDIPPARGRRGKQALKPKEKENAVTKLSEQSSSEETEKLRETEVNTNVQTVRGRKGKQAVSKDKEKENVFKPENQVDNAVYEEEQKAPSDIPATRRGRSTAAAKGFVKPSDPPLASNARRGRSTTKEEGKETRVSRRPGGRKSLSERISESDTSVSPLRVVLPVEENVDDDLDIYTPVARPTKSSARRKTLLPTVNEPASVAVDTVKGNSTRAKSKRKTISGVSDLASVAPSKGLKISSSQRSNAITEDEEAAVGDDNFLGKNDSYSDWIGLKNVDGKIPTSPAIYEVKVWRAKKTAYVGSCESLRQMLTLHKLKQNSGHKHLDKFIERNYNDIQVRYEVVASLNEAKTEVKNRVNNFVAEHKTTPAYN